MDRTMLLISLAAAGGVALLPPAVLGLREHGALRRWAAVGACALAGFLLAPRPAAGVLALPWVAAATAELARRARPIVRARRADLVELGDLAAAGFLVVAGLFALDSCVGRSWFGYGEPITRLTAVHFTFVGVGAVGLAVASLRTRPRSPWRRCGLLALVAGMPLVAAGFATGAAALEVGGPIVVSSGVFLVAGAQLLDGVRQRSLWLVASGLAVWGPMALALAWALAPHTGGPALSIDDMVPLHGGGQALGFVLCGLAGRGQLRMPVGRTDGGHRLSATPAPAVAS
jgi:hypothetical protein